MNEAEIQTKSVIEKGFQFDKNGVTVNHDVDVKGVVSARLICLKTVEVDESAVINGDIIANEVIVKGTVKGNIYAKTLVKLCQNCNVCGKIFYGDLVIEKSAVLSGSSEKLTPGVVDKIFKKTKAFTTPAPAKPAAKQ